MIYVEGYPEFAKPMDSFTQNEIDRNLIRFKTYQTSYSSFVDIFDYSVSVPECDVVEGRMNIFYNPPETLARELAYQTRENITVFEGDRTLLLKTNFHVHLNKFNYLTFNISTAPKHGTLCNYDSAKTQIRNIETFSLENLYLGDVYYCHDDSESTEDSFNLLILSAPETDFQFVCEILVDIKLRNDNGPIRAFDHIFHVVRGESKILSANDLKYSDPDINTNSSEIFYTHVSLSNGALFKSGSAITSFSQDEIDARRILLKHDGPDFGRASFIVTDGVHEVPGALEIQASEPFLKIKESNASIVQEGKFIVIKMDELSVETNLNAKPDEIEYKVIDGPSYGVLKILRRKFNGTVLPKSGNITSTKNFTQLEIDRERLLYWNTEIASMEKIKYRVTAKGIWTDGEMNLRIYPAAYWELLQTRRNQTLYVEESTSVIISKEVLEVCSLQIIFLITLIVFLITVTIFLITILNFFACKHFLGYYI